MERTPEHIDDLLRKRLRGATPPPPAFVWDNVERELRKRKKRFLFWIYFCGITGLGLIGVGMAIALQPGHPFSRVNMIPVQSSNVVPPEGKLQVEHQPLTGSATTTTGVAPTVPGKLNLTKVKSATATAGSTILAVPEKISVSNSLTNPIITKATPSTQDASPQKTIFKEATASISLLPMIPLRPNEPVSLLSSSAGTTEILQQAWPTVLKTRTSKLPSKKATKNCYDFAKQPHAWLLEAYLGPSLAQRELVSSPDNRPYLNNRLSTEQRNLAFNAGIRASLMLKGNFLIRTGVHYDQMTEVFEYIDPEFKRTIVSFEEHPDGTVTIDTVGIEYGEKYQKTFNRFGMLDIPVLAGIELRKGRSGFNINAGMSFNVLFWKRGAIISPETGGPVWFTPGKKDAIDVFRPRTGLNATASVQWFYHVNPRLRVFVEPYFKKVLRPVSLSSHPVEQRYGIGGIHFGLTKILN